MPRFAFAVAAVVAAAVASAEPEPCCAFGGDGSVTLYGTAVVNAAPGSASGRAGLYTFAGGLDATNQVQVALIGSIQASEKSIAGWIISANSTAQTLTFWANNTDGSAPYCYSTSLPSEAGKFIGGFSCCGGPHSGPGNGTSTTPTWTTTYQIGSVDFNVYQSLDLQIMSTFLGSSAGCGMTDLTVATTPFGGGALAAQITGGAPNPPPADWTHPPSFCNM